MAPEISIEELRANLADNEGEGGQAVTPRFAIGSSVRVRRGNPGHIRAPFHIRGKGPDTDTIDVELYEHWLRS